jgi:voltage-gated potassium channel Kch
LATIVLLAYEAIQLLFAKPLQQLLIRQHRRHIVICGLGRVGRSIINDLSDHANKRGQRSVPSRYKIVVIERDKDNPDIAWAESRGANVVIGNATDEDVLTQVRADRAQDVFFSLGVDEMNLEGAYDLMCIVNRKWNESQSHLPRIFVHLLNPRLESMLIQAKKRAFESPEGEGRPLVYEIVVQPFNVIDRSIQALLDGPVLDRRAVKDYEVNHFVIVGFGEVGQELAVKLAQMAHYENLKRARMTIVYSKRDEHAVAHFRELYPKFFPDPEIITDQLVAANLDPQKFDVWKPFEKLDDWSFGVKIQTKKDVDPDDVNRMIEKMDITASRGIEFVVNGGFELSSGGVACDRFISNLQNLSETRGVRPLVFICHADDELNCADATELRDELDVRLKLAVDGASMSYIDGDEHRITILPYVPNRPMLNQLIDPPDKPSADLIPWGDCRLTCTYSELTADIFRPLATAISHDYDLKYAQQHALKNAETAPTREQIAVKPLDAMLAWQRYSNLMAAAHVNAKLAPLDLVLRPCVPSKDYPNPDSTRINSIITRSIYHQLHRDWLVETDDDRLLEMVAKMEHHRWIAERLLMDWRFGLRSAKGKPENKMRLAFVDWANLPEHEGVKDRDQIARILELCQSESNRPKTDRRFVLTTK